MVKTGQTYYTEICQYITNTVRYWPSHTMDVRHCHTHLHRNAGQCHWTSHSLMCHKFQLPSPSPPPQSVACEGGGQDMYMRPFHPYYMSHLAWVIFQHIAVKIFHPVMQCFSLTGLLNGDKPDVILFIDTSLECGTPKTNQCFLNSLKLKLCKFYKFEQI